MNLAASQLAGRTVLVLRPPPGGPELVSRITSAGGSAIYLPTLEIQPLPRDPVLEAVFEQLAAYDQVIFVSINAVTHFVEREPGVAGQLRDRAILAVGERTRAALRLHGIDAVTVSDSNRGSEALLELEQLAPARTAGQRLLIVRGRGGLDVLGEALRQRGATVDYAQVYQRCLPARAGEYANELRAAAWPDIIVVTSLESLQNLLALCDDSLRGRLFKTGLLVISRRLQQAARQLGFEADIIVSAGYSNAHILASLGVMTELDDD